MSLFNAYHGVSAADHQARFNDLSSKGYRIISLSVYDDPSNARYAAVWVQRAGPAWQGFHGLSASDYQGFFNTWTSKGYYPVIVSATGDGSNAVFAGKFEQGNPAPWKARHGITQAEFDSECVAAHAANQILTCVAIYGEGSGRLYAGIWLANSQMDRWNDHSADSGVQYQAWFDAVTQLPSRLSYVSLSSDYVYASVFRDDCIGTWVASHGLTSDQYQAEFDTQTKNGLYPICVQGGGSGSGTRYAAIFATRDQPQARVLTVTGTAVPALAEFDTRMEQVMQAKGVRAASLTLAKNGNIVLSRGYTWAEPGCFAITQPDTLFRLASVSKAFTSAAIYELITGKQVHAADQVYPMLGLKPLPGQKITASLNEITVQNLIDHKGGWDATLAKFDPVFGSRKIAQAMGLKTYPSKSQIAQYMMSQPLQFPPGSNPSLKDANGNPRGPYSNFGYVLLGLVIEHITKKAFIDYVQQVVKPLGISDVFLGHSLLSRRRPNEAIAEDPGLNLTALDPTSDNLMPAAYGGFVVETMDSAGGLIASTQALVKLIHHYAAWGAALRAPGSARTGSEVGTRTRIGSRSDGYDYAFAFDTRFNLENAVDNKGTQYIDKFGDDLQSLLDSTK